MIILYSVSLYQIIGLIPQHTDNSKVTLYLLLTHLILVVIIDAFTLCLSVIALNLFGKGFKQRGEKAMYSSSKL